MINVRKLSKVYGNGESAFTALDAVSFKLQTGANLAIQGKSGSGKSTLMHVIAGLDGPTSGTVTINDTDVWAMPPKELDIFRNKTISFVFQTFYLQNENTVIDNVMVPLEIRGMPFAERKKEAMRALKTLEIDDKADNEASNLSGGQKQRVVIARAIVGSPDIIFADEPTGNLDSKTGTNVENILFKLSKKTNATLIVVTHDEELARRFDNQIYLKDGKITKLSGKGVSK